jgi:hypothetical protein
MSVRNQCGAVSRSGARADPDTAIGSPRMFDATWGDGTITVGHVRENVVTQTVWGGACAMLFVGAALPMVATTHFA